MWSKLCNYKCSSSCHNQRYGFHFPPSAPVLPTGSKPTLPVKPQQMSRPPTQSASSLHGTTQVYHNYAYDNNEQDPGTSNPIWRNQEPVDQDSLYGEPIDPVCSKFISHPW